MTLQLLAFTPVAGFSFTFIHFFKKIYNKIKYVGLKEKKKASHNKMTGCIHRSVSNSNIIIAGSSCSRWQQRQRHTAKHYVASESTGNPQSYIGHFFHQIPLPPPPIAPEIIRATFDLGLQTLTIKLLFLSPVWNKFGSICFLIFPFL